MSDNDKAPGWSVREIKIHERWPVYVVHEGDRMIVQTLSGDDARRIVEAVNGFALLTERFDEARRSLAASVLATDKLIEELTDLVTVVGEP